MLTCAYNSFLQKHYQMEVSIVKKSRKPTRTNLTVLNQICKLIPPYLIPKLARE
jgi:hypothetical protein